MSAILLETFQNILKNILFNAILKFDRKKHDNGRITISIINIWNNKPRVFYVKNE